VVLIADDDADFRHVVHGLLTGLLERLPAGIPAIVITSADPGGLPPGASGLLRKDELTADRLRYAINRIKGAGDE
jgi:hypothetical protein